jgi:hypothetical protein
MKIKLVAGFAVVIIFGFCAYSAALLFSTPPRFSAPSSDPAANPVVIFFKADKSKIENGAAATLRWVVDGAYRIVIDQGVGEVGANGRIDVRPSEITAYNLTAFSEGGAVVSSVIINVVPVVKTASVPPSPAINPGGIPPDVPSNQLPSLKENESYVFYQGAVMVGADDHYVVLRNNPAALNPGWAELKAFLESDQTDRRAYVTGKFTCGDFAELLHNNAEAAGIRAALVAIELRPAGMVEGTTKHSLNAFETTDKGLIYIDTTSSAQGFYADKEVKVEVGREYEPVSIFPQPGQMQQWPSMGRLVAIDIPPLW